MKHCIYCDKKLIQEKYHNGVYYCRESNHRFTVEPNGYIDFVIKIDENELIAFYSKSYARFGFAKNHVLIDDFNILKNKSSEELLEIYNKLKVFE